MRASPLTRFISALVLLLSLPMPAAATSQQPIRFTRFASVDAFAATTLDGTVVEGGSLVLAPGQLNGSWVSPIIAPGFGFTRLVASWNADTPGASRLRVEAQATTAAGETSVWYVLGIWAADDRVLPRTSVNGQADALGKIDTDTLKASGAPATGRSTPPMPPASDSTRS